ncbi:MAG TPA: FAD-dependent oxidoreductase [Sphingomonadaceae bacterium]|nr:FAD-dependent oxidoreductase [Sphingomonadaceae bacterium]
MEREAGLVVIGAGVAGLTAAAVAASHGADVLVIEQMAPGGQISTVEAIRNFPGFPEGIAGYELGPLLQQQAEEAGAAFQFDSVERIEADGARFRVIGAEGAVIAGAVIVAAGSRRRPLGVPGEADFTGRGVSHCASCDGGFFRGQPVVVVGGGDSAFDEAEVLAEQVGEVVIVHREAAPHARSSVRERVEALGNVRAVSGDVVAIEGGDGVARVRWRAGDETVEQPCAGVFVYAGLDPASDFLGDLVARDQRGAIVTDAGLQTARPGLFAAGDIRSGAVALLASAAGEGATAALAAVRYLASR